MGSGRKWGQTPIKRKWGLTPFNFLIHVWDIEALQRAALYV